MSVNANYNIESPQYEENSFLEVQDPQEKRSQDSLAWKVCKVILTVLFLPFAAIYWLAVFLKEPPITTRIHRVKVMNPPETLGEAAYKQAIFHPKEAAALAATAVYGLLSYLRPESPLSNLFITVAGGVIAAMGLDKAGNDRIKDNTIKGLISQGQISLRQPEFLTPVQYRQKRINYYQQKIDFCVTVRKQKQASVPLNAPNRESYFKTLNDLTIYLKEVLEVVKEARSFSNPNYVKDLEDVLSYKNATIESYNQCLANCEADWFAFVNK